MAFRPLTQQRFLDSRKYSRSLLQWHPRERPKSVTVREWLLQCHCKQLNFTIRLEIGKSEKCHCIQLALYCVPVTSVTVSNFSCSKFEDAVEIWSLCRHWQSLYVWWEPRGNFIPRTTNDATSRRHLNRLRFWQIPLGVKIYISASASSAYFRYCILELRPPTSFLWSRQAGSGRRLSSLQNFQFGENTNRQIVLVLTKTILLNVTYLQAWVTV